MLVVVVFKFWVFLIFTFLVVMINFRQSINLLLDTISPVWYCAAGSSCRCQHWRSNSLPGCLYSSSIHMQQTKSCTIKELHYCQSGWFGAWLCYLSGIWFIYSCTCGVDTGDGSMRQCHPTNTLPTGTSTHCNRFFMVSSIVDYMLSKHLIYMTGIVMKHRSDTFWKG